MDFVSACWTLFVAAIVGVHGLHFTQYRRAAYALTGSLGVCAYLALFFAILYNGHMDNALLGAIERGTIDMAKVQEAVIADRRGSRVPGGWMLGLSLLGTELLLVAEFLPRLLKQDASVEREH